MSPYASNTELDRDLSLPRRHIPALRSNPIFVGLNSSSALTVEQEVLTALQPFGTIKNLIVDSQFRHAIVTFKYSKFPLGCILS